MVTLSRINLTFDFRNMKPVYVWKGQKKKTQNTVITLNINIFSFY